MSGICGIVNLNGDPIHRELLERMTAFMVFRGPDAQDVWINGGVGFGHTLLRTTFESAHEQQPFSLDGKVWITADVRIDGRDELKEKLAAIGRDGLGEVTDVALVLHAYHAWDKDCVKHLIGDFAFAIWDDSRRRLFCARDHFGVKPFFYASLGQSLVFSNTLDCLHQHPDVTDTLNDLAIADFLLFGTNQDPGGTAFADIRRLPPAQSLTWSDEGLKLNCYWTLPTNVEIRYRPAGDYVERFREVLEIAIADRLRTRNIAVDMSGGLDSTSVAAIAKRLLAGENMPFGLRAHTIVYDRLIPDKEREFAGMVADKLGISIQYCVADDYRLYQQFDQLGMHLPEPMHAPELAMFIAYRRLQSVQGRVLLTGWDGDTLLNESPKPYFRQLLRERSFGRLLVGVVSYALSERRLLPLRLRAWLRRDRSARDRQKPAYPVWLNPTLEERLGLRARWEQVNATVPASHPVRPYAHRILAYVTKWSNFFDNFDSAENRVPLEIRHPFFDLRVVDFCLTLPPQPWCVKKKILRDAMRGFLPELVRLRPKTPLAGWPAAKLLATDDARWIDDFVAVPGLDAYVERTKILKAWGGSYPERAWTDLRPLSLNFWLKYRQRARLKSRAD